MADAESGALNVPTVKLNDDVELPLLGFGTYKVGVIPGSASDQSASDLRSAEDVITDALKAGYRCFDCAQFYENEAEVGAALSKVDRKSLFIISKVWPSTIAKGAKAVRAQFEKTVNDLQCEYLDLYLVHWPVPGMHREAYEEILKIKSEGKIRSAGVSNYTVENIKELGDLPAPSVNQIEINPFLYRKDTIDFCEKKGTHMQAYRGLTNGKTREHPEITRIAQKLNRTNVQVLGRWLIQHGFSHLPKSQNADRMAENAQIFDFEISEEDMAALDKCTEDSAYQSYRTTYLKCICRDTDLDDDVKPEKFTLT